MKAIVNYGAGHIQLEQVADPVPRQGQVMLRVVASGICGGEYKLGKRNRSAPVAPDISVAGTPAACGVIPGHELVGEVVDPSDSGFAVGTLIAVAPNANCGTCSYCSRGMFHLCPKRAIRTVDIGGGYAEYFIAETRQCFVVPSGISAVEAAMTEPLACCMYAFDKLNLRLGERVLIIGAGANAQLFIQLARLRGASAIMVVDNWQERLELARKLGATVTLDTGQHNPLHTAGFEQGANVVIINRGNPESLVQAIDWCDYGARVLCYGVAAAGNPSLIEPNLLWKKEITLIGSRSFGSYFSDALDLIESGLIDVKSVVNRIIPLEDVMEALKTPHLQIKTIIMPAVPGVPGVPAPKQGEGGS